MTLIREAAVAGQFYPGNSRELSTTIRVLLAEVPSQAGPPPKALIVPHAGYIYSGPVIDAAHEFEHSLEVHLPFLQTVIGSFSLVPLVVGDVAPDIVARVIDALWGGPETLIVISSDLSHYLTYDEARATDRTTCEWIENLQEQNIDHNHACGAWIFFRDSET